MQKKIVFLTGTRADYGKLKSLMLKVENHNQFELHIFATGMHLLSKYGLTYREIEKDGFSNIYRFINQQNNSQMDIALSNTVLGFSNYVSEIKPDLIIVHGDRLEALAGAIVGALNNIKVAHIEGGEVSGTIDESIRHSITKLAHIHFVANEEAKHRVKQLGEAEESIHIIGSPDIDIMNSDELPSIEAVKERYSIPYKKYSILMYHPVTTETHLLKDKIKNVVSAVVNSNKNFIVIYPNNDEGSSIILSEYEKLINLDNFKIYPSIRFEYFLTLLKHCELIIGNSSAGVREASVYGIPSIDLGRRQQGRYDIKLQNNILHLNEEQDQIIKSLSNINKKKFESISYYGQGNSDEKFIATLESETIWRMEYQKLFVDMDNV
ncbi:UDP-N-acetylglucosamine 2-epimerase [Gracilibacillus xinjiangensis]|uniref:UDP-N-acetylglucosamine 2-epimerase n=1 Tax=Gracilibacillus xinjiangensis TaxID=1193282 RepID=A0ABV8WX18_9BACI